VAYNYNRKVVWNFLEYSNLLSMTTLRSYFLTLGPWRKDKGHLISVTFLSLSLSGCSRGPPGRIRQKWVLRRRKFGMEAQNLRKEKRNAFIYVPEYQFHDSNPI